MLKSKIKNEMKSITIVIEYTEDDNGGDLSVRGSTGASVAEGIGLLSMASYQLLRENLAKTTKVDESKKEKQNEK